MGFHTAQHRDGHQPDVTVAAQKTTEVNLYADPRGNKNTFVTLFDTLMAFDPRELGVTFNSRGSEIFPDFKLNFNLNQTLPTSPTSPTSLPLASDLHRVRSVSSKQLFTQFTVF